MARYKNPSKNGLSPIQRKLRRDIITASYLAKACHIGSSLSCVDIIWDIYNKMGKNDLFVFSKASGACALYVVLAEKGYFPRNKVAYYLQKYPLASRKVPGVIIDSGSLGHGLPMACGMALSLKKRVSKENKDITDSYLRDPYFSGKIPQLDSKKVYVLMSDGELQEGTTWECLLFKKQHELDNLIIYVDCNGFQACGKTKDILDLPYHFLIQNGFHCIATTKGSGVSFCENDNSWHYANLSETQYKQALKELE